MFQYLKIDFSTLNLGVPILVRFVPILVRQLVNIGPGQYRYGRIDWLSRSGAEPDCLGGLVRRRRFALLGTRVRAPAPPSRIFPGKSSKSEKIHHRSREEPSDPSSVPFIVRPVPFIVRSVPFIVRSASGSVLFFPFRHSEVLSGPFAVSLWLCWGLEPWSSCCKFSSLTSRAYLRLLRSVLCFDQGDPAYQYWPGPISVRLLRLLRR